MPKLLDLPTELLTLIIEEIGGGELRKDVRKLTLCRKWYDVALEIYLSGRHLRDINIYGCNVNRLVDVGGYSGQRELMQKNTRHLNFRLLGHWRDQSSDDDFGLFHDDSQGISLGKQERTEFDNDPFVFGQRPERSALTEWQNNALNPRLYELFADLHRFTFLESLTFEALQGTENNGSPIERYLNSATMASFLRALSLSGSLKRLTLDLCCDINYNGTHIHVCQHLSRILPRLEEVRLRLGEICTDLFLLENNLQPSDMRLKSLIIKLHLPRYPASSSHPSNLARECDPPRVSWYQRRRREDIIDSTQQYLANIASVRSKTSQRSVALASTTGDESAEQEAKISSQAGHGLTLCRVSYVTHGGEVGVVDCLTMKDGFILHGWPPEPWLARADYGWPCWFEDEDERVEFRGEYLFNQQ